LELRASVSRHADSLNPSRIQLTGYGSAALPPRAPRIRRRVYWRFSAAINTEVSAMVQRRAFASRPCEFVIHL
jgi:hypothetical protein